MVNGESSSDFSNEAERYDSVKAQKTIFERIIKISKSTKEYKKYVEITSLLILDYYKRFFDINKAIQAVDDILTNTTDLNTLMVHHSALKNEENDENLEDVRKSKQKIIEIILDDYGKRFGQVKKEEYNVLVLQSWTQKIENLNELILIMDSVLKFRNKIGNSWDYEIHIIPNLIDKSSNIEELNDYLVSITNLIIGLSERLNDLYLGVMTAVKVLEYSHSPNDVKHYIRELIKKNKDEISALTSKLNSMRKDKISEIKNIRKIQDTTNRIRQLNLINDDISQGIDPKELELERSKR